ncbi:MAG: hypothetical protein MAG431_01714 [Chloroflexi bacterium]|nr:hypothetical protein [Chloroflexota bacterium]
MMLETGIMNVAQLLDTYWVGQLGSAALAAVTISTTIRWVLNSLSNGLGVGGLRGGNALTLKMLVVHCIYY